ncbi:MAG: 1-(5-phosphoribosyl)-5-[(5-phosphoribosylamino)methylideneamino] imidazole-4-carboxamide isomerase [Alphaproteobacteria bacterium GM202ARS2]|nr:1-(5-phosphoribosyl)-5-[(5-phosphoribosylamino)methylideneamino] imidazole-4-carboxamide isomerase [Alphaproteobacteria bacterium GM202ARS2]
MIVYPALDIKEGRCVRLLHGDFAKETVYQEDALAQAQAFVALGVRWLHVVDLDGALQGHAVNGALIERVVDECPQLRIQLGGGIRSLKQAEQWLQRGVERVILGTLVAENLRDGRAVDGLDDVCARYPSRIFVALDCRNGKLASSGWTVDGDTSLLQAVEALQDYGLGGIIYTDIGRDGALLGPDVEGLRAVAEHSDKMIIASGGIRGFDDVRMLHDLNIPTLGGVISGRAFYDGRLDLRRTLQAFPHA